MSSVEKLFGPYATDGSMCEERFKELVHEHCVMVRAKICGC